MKCSDYAKIHAAAVFAYGTFAVRRGGWDRLEPISHLRDGFQVCRLIFAESLAGPVSFSKAVKTSANAIP